MSALLASGSSWVPMDNEKESLGDGCSSAIEKLIVNYQGKANAQISGRLSTASGSKISDVDGSRMTLLPGGNPRSKVEDRGRQKQ